MHNIYMYLSLVVEASCTSVPFAISLAGLVGDIPLGFGFLSHACLLCDGWHSCTVAVDFDGSDLHSYSQYTLN